MCTSSLQAELEIPTIPKRPGTGKAGREIKVLANYFKLEPQVGGDETWKRACVRVCVCVCQVRILVESYSFVSIKQLYFYDPCSFSKNAPCIPSYPQANFVVAYQYDVDMTPDRPAREPKLGEKQGERGVAHGTHL